MLNYAECATEELATAAVEDPGRWEPVLHDVRQIGVSGARAAALTRRLLSFARGDMAQVGSVDLNEVVSGIVDMLRRTLGADVVLRLSMASSQEHTSVLQSLMRISYAAFRLKQKTQLLPPVTP